MILWPEGGLCSMHRLRRVVPCMVTFGSIINIQGCLWPHHAIHHMHG